MGSTFSFRRAWRIGTLALALVATAPFTARAQEADEVKAGFVINFLKFTDWPDLSTTNTNAPITLAIIATPALTATFTSVLAGTKVHGRTLHVRTINPDEVTTNAPLPCHALYIAPEAMSAWPDIRANLSRRPILTISDAPRFCEVGGMLMLALLEKEKRYRFSANPSAATLAGLKLRSELLKLATIVKTEEEAP
jgi:hypothetical protein